MRGRLGLATVLCTLGVAPGAFAEVKPELAGTTLTVTADAGQQAITVTGDATSLTVAGPVLSQDPDGGGADCTLAGDVKSVTCVESAVAALVIDAAGGDDTVTVARNADSTTVHGDAGDDTLGGTPGNAVSVTLDGGEDDDTLTIGGFGTVALTGGPGNDTLRAGAARFDVDDDGGPGDDRFEGNPEASDDMYKEPGADTYLGGEHDPAADALDDEGCCWDSVSYGFGVDPAQPVNVSLDGVANDGVAGEGDDVGIDIESIQTSTAPDVVTCGSRPCSVVTSGGDDRITGGSANDSLFAGNGADVIAGLGGDDRLAGGDAEQFQTTDPPVTGDPDQLDGGPGDDELLGDPGSDDLAGGPGTDQAYLARRAPIDPLDPVSVDLPFTVSLDDVANDGQTGTAEADNVRSDIERLTLGDGDDVVTGGAGAQRIETRGGADRVDPGGGADYVDTGDGDDQVAAQDGATDTVHCGDGADTATLDLAGAQPDRADVAYNCETVGGTPFGPVPVLPGPAVDRADPVVTLARRKVARKAFARRGVVTVTVGCDEACAVAGEVLTTQAKLATVGRLAVGGGTLRLGTGKRTLKLRVRAKYRKTFRRKLRRRKRVPLIVGVTATDAAGNETSKSTKVTVR